MKEIADEGNPEPVRQMACIICKNLVQPNQTVSLINAALTFLDTKLAEKVASISFD